MELYFLQREINSKEDAKKIINKRNREFMNMKIVTNFKVVKLG
jgi:hypothetical protein